MEGKGHDYKHYLYSESLLKITSSQKNLPEEGVKTQKHTHTQTHTLSERDGKLKAKTETEVQRDKGLILRLPVRE